MCIIYQNINSLGNPYNSGFKAATIISGSELSPALYRIIQRIESQPCPKMK